MSLTDNIKELPKKIMGKIFESQINEIVDEKFNKRFTAAVRNEKEDETWRRITHVKRLRDLSPLKQDKMIKVVDWLYDRNPLAKKIMSLPVDFILGDGVEIKMEGIKDTKKKVAGQHVIDRFWEVNEWELKQFVRIEELGKYGEQAYKTFINDYNGIVMLGAVDPERISKVIPHKENCEIMEKMVIKGTADEESLDIIRMDWKASKMIGEVFFFPVNKGSHGTRGKSDILSLCDWLDNYDRTLYTTTERISFLLTFVWDITMNGANDAELQKRLNTLKMEPPKPGGYNVHNEREVMEAMAPDLRGRDLTDFFKLLSTFISGGSNIPFHWLLGTGESANKASAKEMSEPIYKQLKRRQKYVVNMFRFMTKFQIQQAIEAKILTGKVDDYPFSVIIAEPSKKEAEQLADAFAQMMPALAIATMNDFISKDTAQKLTTMFTSQFGVDTKPADEEDKIKKQYESPVHEAVSKLYKSLNPKKPDKAKRTGK